MSILTADQVHSFLVAAGWPDDQIQTAMATAWAESRFDASQVSINTNGSHDCGLLQVNRETWPELAAGGDLLDPAYNARAALSIYRYGGWDLWSTHRVQNDNNYTHFMAQFAGYVVRAPVGGTKTMAVGNLVLAQAADNAIIDDAFVSIPGRCEEFAREVIQSVYGSRYDDMYGATAADTGETWAAHGFVVNDDPQPGDILFKCYFEPGHVGIVAVDGERVAENSSTQIGRVDGAKGWRTIEQWGRYSRVIRIPSPVHYDALLLGGVTIARCPLENDSHLCPVREWAAALGFDLEGTVSAGLTFNGQAVPGPLSLIGGHAYAPLQGLVRAAGLHVVSAGNGQVVIGR